MVAPNYVVSSNIDAIGYQLGQLFVLFKSGVSYRYEAVPYTIYDALLKVESVGKSFHHLVKGKFHYTRLNFNPFTKG